MKIIYLEKNHQISQPRYIWNVDSRRIFPQIRVNHMCDRHANSFGTCNIEIDADISECAVERMYTIFAGSQSVWSWTVTPGYFSYQPRVYIPAAPDSFATRPVQTKQAEDRDSNIPDEMCHSSQNRQASGSIYVSFRVKINVLLYNTAPINETTF
jgi:hypothetical protein